MKVYVIMANDFPDCVFAEELQATAYVAAKDLEEREKADKPWLIRIYWRIHAFEVTE